MKTFLNELGEDSQAWAQLALFGKHPAWSDHMEDFGIDTQTLAQFKQWLYVDGVGKNLSSGKWERLNRQGSSIEFGHLFVWQRGSETLIGRLESSEDRKGRDQYPLVVVVHSKNWQVGQALGQLQSLFADLIQRVRSASEPDQVRRWYDEAVRSLSSIQIEEYSTTTGGEARRRSWIHSPRWGPEKEELARVAHAATVCWQNDSKQTLSLRVAIGVEPVESAIETWVEFLRSLSSEDLPIFISRSDGQPTFDVMMGPPENESFFFLKAGPSEIASTTDTPFTLVDGFAERLRQHCDTFVLQGSHTPPFITEKRQGFNPFGFLTRRSRGKADFNN